MYSCHNYQKNMLITLTHFQVYYISLVRMRKYWSDRLFFLLPTQIWCKLAMCRCFFFRFSFFKTIIIRREAFRCDGLVSKTVRCSLSFFFSWDGWLFLISQVIFCLRLFYKVNWSCNFSDGSSCVVSWQSRQANIKKVIPIWRCWIIDDRVLYLDSDDGKDF